MSVQAIILVGIAYIGRKPTKLDTYFGTNLLFARGEVHQVPNEIGNKMARHQDVYALETSATYKAWKEKFEQGTLTDDAPAPSQSIDPAQVIRDKVTELRLELGKLTKKDQIKKHEVAVALNIEFSDDDTMTVMTEKVCDAYQAKLEATLGGAA